MIIKKTTKDIETNSETLKKHDPIWESETNHHAHSSEWIGAIVSYLIFFGKKDFNHLYVSKERNKNSFIGTLVKLIIFFLIIYLVFRFAI